MPPELEPASPNERFRTRRDEARKRRRQHRTVAVAVALVAAALVALGATVIGTRATHRGGSGEEATSTKQATPATPQPFPVEVRGVHVTMGLASLPGKFEQYLAIPGLNTIELDVKDENGKVGFLLPARSLARQVGASQPYYRAKAVAAKARKAGVYLIGRIVVFEDPALVAKRPDMAIRTSDGSLWRNNAGLGWANPYDQRVWQYNVSVAEAAARAGFDEIQFDYVRFPSDGPIESAVFSHKAAEPMGWTITRFVHYASTRLKPLGVRVSVDVFGLSATHELGIGQKPGRLAKYVDAVYPMVYPSHYNSGEFNLPNPSASPGQDGLHVAAGLPECTRRSQGRADSVARGFLAERWKPPAGRSAGADRRGAQESHEGLPPLESRGRLHGGSPKVVSGGKRRPEELVTEKYQELKTRLAAIHDLNMARAILGWDQHTMMPPKAGPLRAEQLGTIDRFAHELFIDDEIGRLLEDARDYEESLDPDSDDARLIRVTRRDYEKARRLPPELRAELTRTGANALAAWVEAREKSDFSIFLPYLKKNVELQHRYIACFEDMGYRERLRRAPGRLRRGSQDRRRARGVRRAQARPRPAHR